MNNFPSRSKYCLKLQLLPLPDGNYDITVLTPNGKTVARSVPPECLLSVCCNAVTVELLDTGMI